MFGRLGKLISHEKNIIPQGGGGERIILKKEKKESSFQDYLSNMEEKWDSYKKKFGNGDIYKKSFDIRNDLEDKYYSLNGEINELETSMPSIEDEKDYEKIEEYRGKIQKIKTLIEKIEKESKTEFIIN